MELLNQNMQAINLNYKWCEASYLTDKQRIKPKSSKKDKKRYNRVKNLIS